MSLTVSGTKGMRNKPNPYEGAYVYSSDFFTSFASTCTSPPATQGGPPEVWATPAEQETRKGAKRAALASGGAAEKPVVVQFQRLLNKLAIDNLDSLAQSFISVVGQIRRVAECESMVTTLGDYVLQEPRMAGAVAGLCAVLNAHAPSFSQDNNHVSFKSLVLNRCQVEFAKNPAKIVAFMGELYRHGVLGRKIMHAHVLRPLLNADGDVQILGKLLAVVGPALEGYDKILCDKCFRALDAALEGSSMSSRDRFALLDIIEARANDWEGAPKAPRAVEPLEGSPTTEEVDGWTVSVPQGPSTADEPRDGGLASSKKKVSFAGKERSLEDHVEALLDELFSSHEIDEATLAFSEIKGGDQDPLDFLVRMSLERESPNMSLLAKVVKKLKLPKARLDTCIKDVHLDMADIVIDFPKATAFMSEFEKGL